MILTGQIDSKSKKNQGLPSELEPDRKRFRRDSKMTKFIKNCKGEKLWRTMIANFQKGRVT